MAKSKKYSYYVEKQQYSPKYRCLVKGTSSEDRKWSQKIEIEFSIDLRDVKEIVDFLKEVSKELKDAVIYSSYPTFAPYEVPHDQHTIVGWKLLDEASAKKLDAMLENKKLIVSYA